MTTRRKSKPVIGRPALDPAARRATTIKVMVTSTEKTAMDACASAGGLSVSTWLRTLALAAVRQAKPPGIVK